MFVRLYRNKRLVATVPVDEVRVLPETRGESPTFAARVVVKSKVVTDKYGGFMTSDGWFMVAYNDRYGHWRLGHWMSQIMGSRTGVTFSHIEILP